MTKHLRSGPRPLGEKSIPETLTYSGAHKLAQQLRDFWAAQGKSPVIDVVREESVRAWQARTWDRTVFDDPAMPGIWVVRSDMLNGAPR